MNKVIFVFIILFFLWCASQKKSLREELASIKEPEKTQEVVSEEKKKSLKETKIASPQIDATNEARENFEEAKALFAKNLFEESKEKFQNALLLEPNLIEGNYFLGVISFREGKLEDAINFLKKYLENKRDSIKALSLLQKIYFIQRRGDEFYSLIKEIKEEYPDNILIANLFLRTKLEMGDIAGVLRAASELLKKDETNIEIAKTIAIYYIKVNKLDMAKFVIENALEMKKDAELYSLLAEIYIKKEKNLLAIDAYKKALESNPQFANAHNNLGVLYSLAGDYESAIIEFDEGIKNCPYFPEIYVNKGNALRKLMRFDEAKEVYENAINLNSDMPEIYYNLGILHLEYKKEETLDEKIKRYNKAIEYFNKYKEKRRGVPERHDPVEKYIAEAKKMVNYLIEKKEQELKAPIEIEKKELEEEKLLEEEEKKKVENREKIL